MPDSSLSARSFERILLIKPSAVGDVVHAVPILAKLRARYPSAQIDWLLNPAIAELIGGHPALSNVVPFDRSAYARAWRSWAAAASLAGMISAVRRARYDLVVDLHGQFRSAVLAWASGAAVRIGFDRPRRRPQAESDRRLNEQAYVHGWTGAREGAWLAYTHRIPIPALDVHAVDRYLWLRPILGLDDGPPDFRLPVSPEAEDRMDALMERGGMTGRPLAVLVPGTLWETKHWHVEGFAEVARGLTRRGFAVALAGSPAERGRCQAVAALCPGVRDLSGRTTLSDLAALIRRAEICVTNDSGSMHLAVALGRPVVSVFGPTDPIWIGPYGRPRSVVQSAAACSPCYLRKLRACPHGHACMTEVTGAMVMDRVEEVLAQTHQAAC
ncbi:MAG TPA: lipopolysaccharide heptosyltransferase II [Gemmataceae bacterium]|nr:lipopolysaccharide heptosyltransferase II [Gemmataceae bacterium]